MNWLTASFFAIAIGACWYFDRVTKAREAHDAMIDDEERKIRDDAKAMRAWYAQKMEDRAEVEAFLASIEQK